MYVRSYGMPPRNVRKDGEALGDGISPTQANDISPLQANPSEDLENNINETGSADKHEMPDAVGYPTEPKDKVLFGENGLPRQPLRRRKRPKSSLEHGKSPKNEPVAEQCDDDSSEPLSPLGCTYAAPSPVNPKNACGEEQTAKKSREERMPVQDPLPCHNEPQKALCRFSAEELLLGGLIILLINGQASDDILLILAFLLVSGMDLTR